MHTTTIPEAIGPIGGIKILPESVFALTQDPPEPPGPNANFDAYMIDAAITVLPREAADLVFKSCVKQSSTPDFETDAIDCEADVLFARWTYSPKEDLIMAADKGGSDLAQSILYDTIEELKIPYIVYGESHFDARSTDANNREIKAIIKQLYQEHAAGRPVKSASSKKPR